MPSESNSQLERDLLEAKGALDILSTLREEFAQWAEEAQDDSKREALDNVLAHVEALESQTRAHRAALESRTNPA